MSYMMSRLSVGARSISLFVARKVRGSRIGYMRAIRDIMLVCLMLCSCRSNVSSSAIVTTVFLYKDLINDYLISECNIGSYNQITTDELIDPTFTACSGLTSVKVEKGVKGLFDNRASQK